MFTFFKLVTFILTIFLVVKMFGIFLPCPKSQFFEYMKVCAINCFKYYVHCVMIKCALLDCFHATFKCVLFKMRMIFTKRNQNISNVN